MHWRDRWYAGTAGPPAVIHHLDCHQDAIPVRTCEHCHGMLTVDSTTQLPGPGGAAGPGTRLLDSVLTRNRT